MFIPTLGKVVMLDELRRTEEGPLTTTVTRGILRILNRHVIEPTELLKDAVIIFHFAQHLNHVFRLKRWDSVGFTEGVFGLPYRTFCVGSGQVEVVGNQVLKISLPVVHRTVAANSKGYVSGVAAGPVASISGCRPSSIDHRSCCSLWNRYIQSIPSNL